MHTQGEEHLDKGKKREENKVRKRDDYYHIKAN